MADSGLFPGDTGSDGSDTSHANNDTGNDIGNDTGNETDTGNEVDTGNAADTGNEGDTAGAVQRTNDVYSAAELANDKGGCSTAGGTHSPWMASLIGLLLGFRRRRLA